MLAERFGVLIKAERHRMGLKQADVARSAKVSRSVLSRLEGGKPQPVQTDVLERLLDVLGLKPQIAASGAGDAERVLARIEQQRKLEQQRSRHYRLAIDLSGDEPAAARMVAKARDRVDLWRDKRSCSAAYIDRWSEILALPPRAMAMAIASLGDWEDALFQNSPWSWAWN